MVPEKPAFVTTLTDEAWSSLPLSERALHVARSQLRLNVREITRNWGGMVTVYLRLAGWRIPQPWCAAFVYWCLVTAGADRKKLWDRPASTYSLYQWAKAEKRIHDFPKRGRLFVWNGRLGGHTGFVREHVDRHETFSTIEGNTNSAGSREGDRVAERVRSASSIRNHPRFGFIDLGGLE
ncbi:MAG: CHAP domain-containing protein [Bryobacteraceae bacterium]